MLRLKQIVGPALVLAGFLNVQAFAQPAGGPPGPSARGTGGGRSSRGIPVLTTQMLAQGDKDGDKELSKEELINLVEAWFDKVDEGKSGKITQEQLTTRLRDILPVGSSNATSNATPGSGSFPDAASAGISPEVLGPILFARTDTDKDGSLTRAEFKDAFTGWFAGWDTSSRGKVSEIDLRRGLETALPRSGNGLRPGEGATPSRSRAAAEDGAPARQREAAGPLSTGLPASRTERARSTGTEEPLSSLGVTNFARYKLISDRNIFNSSRRPDRRDSGERERPRRTDTLTLVGVIQYEKGAYAFFDGSSSEYRAVLETGKTIADHKITAVEPESVKLQAGTNTVELRMGMQMRREEGGDWTVVAGSGRPTLTTPAAASGSSESSSADDDDIVKRLMKQREEEMK